MGIISSSAGIIREKDETIDEKADGMPEGGEKTESSTGLRTVGEEKSGEDGKGGEKVEIGDQEQEGEGEEDEEAGECGFCLFMKGGGCRDTFIAWEDCVKLAEDNKEDIVEKCHQVTANLTKCMRENSDYYEPILRAEKMAEEELAKEREKLEGNASEKSTEENTSEIVVEQSNESAPAT